MLSAGPASSYQNPGAVIEKNGKLADYIKYDAQLGREQNITMAKESSLGNQEVMEIKEGVTLS